MALGSGGIATNEDYEEQSTPQARVQENSTLVSFISRVLGMTANLQAREHLTRPNLRRASKHFSWFSALLSSPKKVDIKTS